MAEYRDEVLPYEKAKALADMNQLSPEFLAKNYGDYAQPVELQPQAPMAQPMSSAMPIPAPAAPQAPQAPQPDGLDNMILGAASKRQETQSSSKDSKNISAAEEAQKQADKLRGILESNIKADVNLGLQPDAIKAKYAKDYDQIKTLETQANSLIPQSAKAAIAKQEAPAAAGEFVDEGSSTPAGQQQQPQQSISNNLMNGVNQGFDLQKEAAVDAAATGQKKAVEQASYWSELNKQVAQMNAAENQRRVVEQADMDKRMNDVDSAIKELGSMSVSTGNYWNNKDTGDKIGIGIALALGALGGAGGGGNKASGIIMEAINQDLKAQQANIDKQKDVVSSKRGLFSQALDRVKDNRLAFEVAKSSAIEQTKLKIAESDAKYKSPEIQAQAKELYGKLTAEQAITNAKIADMLKSNQQIQFQDPVAQKISVLPASQQNRAYEELGKVQEWNNLTKDVMSSYADIQNVGQEGRIPSALGGKSEDYESKKGKMSGVIVGKVPGIKSDNDFKTVVEPMLPKPGETKAAAEAKRKNFEGFMKAYAPSSPLLDALGARPQPASERIPSKKGF